MGPSSTFFSTPTGAILPTAATKRALPRVRQGPVRTLAGQPAARRPTPRYASQALRGPRCRPRSARLAMSAGSHRVVRLPRRQETSGDQAAAEAAMRKGAATAAAAGAGAGAAWAEDALAPSLGQGAQQHPPPDHPAKEAPASPSEAWQPDRREAQALG